MTEEQRKAASDRMKAYHAAKKQKAKVNKALEPIAQGLAALGPQDLDDSLTFQAAIDAAYKGPLEQYPVEPQAPPQMSPEDINSLLRRVQELERQAAQHKGEAAWNQPRPDPRTGRLIGTIEKYIIDPKHYPDPRERLAREPRLQRFAFSDNYELEFEVTSTQYETKDGVNMREPKFTLALIRIMYDDAGERTNDRFTVCRAIFHEDPQSAIVVARENGLPVDETNEKGFLDEMRYLRMRDWLLEAFYPPKPIQAKQNKREMVIGNKLVEVFEINSEQSETMPFSQLKNKL